MRVKTNGKSQRKMQIIFTALKFVFYFWCLFVSIYLFICAKTSQKDFEKFERFRRNNISQLKQMRIENNRYFFLQQMFADLRTKNIRIAPEYWRLLSRSEFNIRSYKVVDVKLADIRVCSGRDIELNGAMRLVEDVKNQNSDNERSKAEQNLSNDFDSIRFDILKKEMSNTTYDISKAIIVVDSTNCVLDGYHRIKILLEKYNKNYKIKVLKFYF